MTPNDREILERMVEYGGPEDGAFTLEESRAVRTALAEIDKLRAEIAVVSTAAGQLLAVIHGDGGHHTEAVGFKQSCLDAELKWYERDHDEPARAR
jgi:hypothetical protein